MWFFFSYVLYIIYILKVPWLSPSERVYTHIKTINNDVKIQSRAHTHTNLYMVGVYNCIKYIYSILRYDHGPRVGYIYIMLIVYYIYTYIPVRTSSYIIILVCTKTAPYIHIYIYIHEMCIGVYIIIYIGSWSSCHI